MCEKLEMLPVDHKTAKAILNAGECRIAVVPSHLMTQRKLVGEVLIVLGDTGNCRHIKLHNAQTGKHNWCSALNDFNNSNNNRLAKQSVIHPDGQKDLFQ